MVRENNKKEYKGPDEEMPKFGAGSEFGRQEREEARLRKFGYMSRKYDPDTQPWLMRVGSKKDGKHFKGSREGGISDNASYYIFTHAADGSFEAHPVKEWYNFAPRITHKTMDADEAELKFAERGKILNHWAMSINKKLKPDQDQNEDEKGKGGSKKGGEDGASGSGKNKDFKISDLEDTWLGSDDELGSDESDDDNSDKKKKDDSDDKNGGKKKKKKSKEDVDNEAFEDSDDGEGEGREVDYMSDESSEDEMEEQTKYVMSGVDQDEGLAKMLESDSDSDDDKDKDKEGNASDDDDEEEPAKKEKKQNSRSGSPAPETSGSDDKAARAEKRKAMVDKLLDPNAEPATKKSRLDAIASSAAPGPTPSTSANVSGLEANIEEDVRRYLTRKPMTTTELLRKIHSKKPGGLSKAELMPYLANILKRLSQQVKKQRIKGEMYLSIKTG